MWELKLDNPLPKNLKIKKEKIKKEDKNCSNIGCENKVKSRSLKSKYCSIKCSAEHKRKWRIKNCKKCNTSFQSSRERKYYCSTKCLRERAKVVRHCQNKNCGAEIKSKFGKKYCSQDCFKNFKAEGVIRYKNCQFSECGKELTKIKIRYGQKYCGKECYQNDRKKNDNIGAISFWKKRNSTYPRRFIKTENGWQLFAKFIWEKNNGTIPEGHYVGFKDGDSFNDDIENLYLRRFDKNLKSYKNKK